MKNQRGNCKLSTNRPLAGKKTRLDPAEKLDEGFVGSSSAGGQWKRRGERQSRRSEEGRWRRRRSCGRRWDRRRSRLTGDGKRRRWRRIWSRRRFLFSTKKIEE
ncbi:unnamed protein product [Linum trigynum]|uniref:Uncharacterized protein n=1 Tax=Linum trigynum TaxID=586398 RepID=A0AAV2E3D1_9ROSI